MPGGGGSGGKVEGPHPKRRGPTRGCTTTMKMKMTHAYFQSCGTKNKDICQRRGNKGDAKSHKTLQTVKPTPRNLAACPFLPRGLKT